MINLWKVSTLTLVGALGIGAVGGGIAYADAQPKMREALALLKTTKTTLDGASDDKGGHRRKAIQLVDSAMAEVQAGIDFDNAHGGDKKSADGDTTVPQLQ